MSEVAAEEQEEQIEVLEDEIEAEEVDETVDDDQVEDDVELDGEEQEAEDSVEITLDDESLTSDEDNQPAPKWVKELRKTSREQQKENRELKQELERVRNTAAPAPEALKKKPTLEALDYDTEKYEAEYASWVKQESKVEENKATQEAEHKQYEQEYQASLNSYEKSKKGLGVKDYDDAEHVVLEHFNVEQQNVILNSSEDAALLVYAIGKNSQRTKDLAKIKNPVKLAFALAEIKGKIKVNKRKATTNPESKVTGSAKKSGVDSTLERLETESLKTNDRSKIVAYKMKLRAKNKK